MAAGTDRLARLFQRIAVCMMSKYPSSTRGLAAAPAVITAYAIEVASTRSSGRQQYRSDVTLSMTIGSSPLVTGTVVFGPTPRRIIHGMDRGGPIYIADQQLRAF